MIYKNTSRMICTGALSCLMSLSASAQVIYSNGFDSLSNGEVTDDQIKDSWNSRYAKGPDEGRVTIVNDSISGKAARVAYPAFTNQSSPSGATWETDIGHSADELYMSYWVKVDSDFQFVKGGKLPGLGGSTSFPRGENDFTTRLMWREDGKLEFYLHGFQVNNSAGAEPYRVFWDDFGEHARLKKGQWHHIEIHQVLNTPGVRDGRLQGWLDGVLVCDSSDNSGVRAVGQSDTKINHLFFSTFFGGSSAPVTQWQPTDDVYANFDDFTVSTQPIGMHGFPGDVSGGGNGDNDNPVLTAGTNNIRIRNANNDRCLQANGSNNGDLVISSGCDNGADQKLDVLAHSSTPYLKLRFDSNTLNLDAGNAADNQDVKMWRNSNHLNRRLEFIPNGQYFMIKSVTSNKCVQGNWNDARWQTCSTSDIKQQWYTN